MIVANYSARIDCSHYWQAYISDLIHITSITYQF